MRSIELSPRDCEWITEALDNQVSLLEHSREAEGNRNRIDRFTDEIAEVEALADRVEALFK